MTGTRLTATLAAAGFALFSSGALAQPDTSVGTTTPTQPPANQHPTTGPSGNTTAQPGQGKELAEEDQKFLEEAAQSGHAEVEGSRLALESASSPAVKEFAQKMVDDHTKAHDELIALAQRKGFTPPDEPSMVQRTEILGLRALSGETFDRMYAARIGEAAHENAVELFQRASAEAKDPDIRAYAEKHLPKLREHLEAARAMRQQVGKD